MNEKRKKPDDLVGIKKVGVCVSLKISGLL
jgi:hypothetical protein